MQPVLRVEGLRTALKADGRRVPALHDVSFDLMAGETLALVGESGSGKSMTALSVMGLLPTGIVEAEGGKVLLGEFDLLQAGEVEMRRVRGNQISMIFQEPMTSLNPVMTVGEQIVEVLVEHRALSRREARTLAVSLLERVRIADAAARLDDYPHRLSGGMRQRIMIAMALACEPAVLIADEPTTALDVTIQAQILGLLCELQQKSGTAILLITHNLGVVAQVADDVAVMYAGSIVEYASVRQTFLDPLHPYTMGLLGSTADIDADVEEDRTRRLVEIPGMIPPFDALPEGCAFAPRCPKAVDKCRVERPALIERRDGRKVACHVAISERGL